jgi:hypothetical protein
MPRSLVDNLVAFSGRLYILPVSPLLHELLAVVHEDDHEGVQRTLHRLRRDFHSTNMRVVVQDFVRACDVCQRNKSEYLHPAGRLLPLSVPTSIWADVDLDFVEALPRINGKSVILTVVDCFSKYYHFIPLAHPYTAESVTHAFFSEIVRLHGMPQSMVSERVPVFTSAFWRELWRLTGAKLHMTSAFHPQFDGQAKVANKVIVMFLHYLTGDCPCQWLRLLPWAEYVYNTAYLSTLRDTPFRVVYGHEPPSIRSYEPGEMRVAAVARSMEECDEFLADVRVCLEQAQAVYKHQYDKRHCEVKFEVGDWALLRLCYRAPASLQVASSGKLQPRYYGPFRVAGIINDVTYRQELPPGAHTMASRPLLRLFSRQSTTVPWFLSRSRRCGFAWPMVSMRFSSSSRASQFLQ